MTDDVQRHLESLLREFGEVSKLQVRHDERIREATADREEIRESIAKMELELKAAIGRSEKRTRDLVTTVKASCDKGWSDMATWVQNFEQRERDKLDRADEQAYTSKWQRRGLALGIASAVIAALGVIIALVGLLLGAFG